MAERIPQSVTLRVPLKLYLSDGVTEATGKTAAVVLSQNGGVFANPSGGATNATEIASGWYYVDLSTTDTGTLGPLLVRATATGCDPAETIYNVVIAHNAGFDGIPNVAAGGTNGLPTVDANNAVKVQSGTGANQISLSSGAVLLQATQTGVTIPTVTNLTNAPTAGDFTATMKTSLNAATPASIVGAVGSVVGNVGGDVVGSVGSVSAGVTVSTNNDKTGYSLAVTPPTASQNAVAVVDQALSGHTTAGTVGGQLNEISAVTDPLTNPVPGSYAVGTAGYDIALLTNINAKISSATITVLSPFSSSGALTLKQWQTYSAAIGTQIQLTCTVPTDPTGVGTVVTFTFLFGLTPLSFTGSVISYDSVAGTALFGLELTSAQSGALTVTNSAGASFALSVKLPASAGNLVEVAYTQGKLQVLGAPPPP